MRIIRVPIEQVIEADIRSHVGYLNPAIKSKIVYGHDWFGIEFIDAEKYNFRKRFVLPEESDDNERQCRANRIALHLVRAFDAVFAEFQSPDPKFQLGWVRYCGEENFKVVFLTS